MSESQKNIRIGITMGDPNGISPEVIMKALWRNDVLAGHTTVVYGSVKVLSEHKKACELNEIAYQSVPEVDKAVKAKINVINVLDEKNEVEIEMGHPTQKGGLLAMKALEAATQDLAAGKIDVLVTGPIHKKAIRSAGFEFPGHTEYLASMSQVNDSLMIMCKEDLRVAVATGHIALDEVSENLSKDMLEHRIEMLHKSLVQDFLIEAPKIAVMGLNPHAGENGTFGNEEMEVISPAIQASISKGYTVYGPYPADGFFGSGTFKKFDGILAMYHDQGLIPFKTLADGGVNFTAGLPIVRSSPDHGTAMDIAGQDKGDPRPMREAIYLAIDVFRNRQLHTQWTKDALPPAKREKA